MKTKREKNQQEKARRGQTKETSEWVVRNEQQRAVTTPAMQAARDTPA